MVRRGEAFGCSIFIFLFSKKLRIVDDDLEERPCLSCSDASTSSDWAGGRRVRGIWGEGGIGRGGKRGGEGGREGAEGGRGGRWLREGREGRKEKEGEDEGEEVGGKRKKGVGIGEEEDGGGD